MVDNSLAKMVSVAQQNDLLLGLANNIIQKGVAMLQYADDTILLIQDNMEQARNLKLLLYIFEAMSGLKIKFEKSEVMMIMQDDRKIQCYPDLFNCQEDTWPIKYLGTTICARRPIVAKMRFLGDKTKNKMSGWVGNNMSIGGRMIKISAFLSSIGVYQMSMRLLYNLQLKRWISLIDPFSGMAVQIKENITLSDGDGFINQRRKEAWD
jgi:hypothetical protein